MVLNNVKGYIVGLSIYITVSNMQAVVNINADNSQRAFGGTIEGNAKTGIYIPYSLGESVNMLEMMCPIYMNSTPSVGNRYIMKNVSISFSNACMLTQKAITTSEGQSKGGYLSGSGFSKIFYPNPVFSKNLRITLSVSSFNSVAGSIEYAFIVAYNKL